MSQFAVIAIGGNTIIKNDKCPNIPDEYAAVGET
jgi:carbamate kinase